MSILFTYENFKNGLHSLTILLTTLVAWACTYGWHLTLEETFSWGPMVTELMLYDTAALSIVTIMSGLYFLAGLADTLYEHRYLKKSK